jgi:hypothetical protein
MSKLTDAVLDELEEQEFAIVPADKELFSRAPDHTSAAPRGVLVAD